MEKHASDRLSIFRQCKLEDIALPLKGKTSLKEMTIDVTDAESALTQGAPASFDSSDDDEDEDDIPLQQKRQSATTKPTHASQARRARIQKKLSHLQADYEALPIVLRQIDRETATQQLQTQLAEIEADLERLAPALRSMDRLDNVEHKLKRAADDFEEGRREVKEARAAFAVIRKKRFPFFLFQIKR